MSDLIERLRELANKFSEGWHDGIRIDASDIVDICDSASALEQQAGEIERLKSALQMRARQVGVACLKHDLTHSLTCGHCAAELRAENAELRKDAARLDWVESRAGKEWERFRMPDVWFVGTIAADKQTLRGCIDTAMEGKK